VAAAVLAAGLGVPTAHADVLDLILDPIIDPLTSAAAAAGTGVVNCCVLSVVECV